MDFKLAFKVLGIDVTQNEDEIKNAYRELLPGCNPEDNPEGFMQLREAFEVAMEYAKSSGHEEKMESEEARQFQNALEELYEDYERRIKTEEWEQLLDCPFCVSLETTEIAREKLLVFLMGNYRLPHAIWKCFDKVFAILEDKKELNKIFPGDFMDYVANRIQTDDEFPYEELKITDILMDTDIDAYLTELFRLEGMITDFEWGMECALSDMENVVEKLDEYGIRHPYQAVSKLHVLLFGKKYEEAASVVETLKNQDFKDDCVYYALGKYEWETENEELAFANFVKAIEMNPNHYTAKLHLAKIDFHQKKYYECREKLEALLSVNSNHPVAQQLINATNEEYVKILTDEYENGIEDEHFKKGMLPIELGWCLFQMNENEKCVEVLESMKPEEDEWYAYHNLFGRVLCSMERYEEGLSHLKEWNRILDHTVYDGSEETQKRIARKSMAATMLGNCYFNLGNIDAAIENFEKGIALASDPNEKVDVLYQLAGMFFEIKEYYKCVDKCDELLDLNRRYYAGYVLRQRAFYELHMGQGVIDDYYNATNIYAGHFLPYYYAAQVFFEVGQDDDCKAVFDRARENGVEFSPKMKLLDIKLRRTMVEDDADEIVYRTLLNELDKIDSMRDEEDFDIEDVSEINFVKGLLYWHLSALDESETNHAMVKKHLAMSIHENPKALRSYTAYCDFIMQPCRRDDENKYLDEAEKYYNKAIEQVGRVVPVLYGLGMVYYLRDKMDKGIEYFDEVLEQADTYRNACTIVKDYYLDLYGRKYDPVYFEKAIAAISREIDANPNCDFYIDRGLVYLRAYKLDLAIADFEAAISHDPDFWSPYNNLGCCYKYLGEYDKAIEYGQKALECLRNAGQKASNPYTNMRDCYTAMGEFDKAIECCVKAVDEMGYDKEDAYASIADFYIRSGDFDNALITAKEKCSDYIYQKTLVEIELRKGNREKALQLAEESLKLCKDNESYAEGLEAVGDWYETSFDGTEKSIEYNKKCFEIAEDRMRYNFERNICMTLVINSLILGKEIDDKYMKKIREYIKDMEDNLENTLNFLRERPYNLSRYAKLQACIGNYNYAKELLSKVDECKKCSFCKYKACYEKSLYLGNIYFIEKDYANAKRMYEEAMDRSGNELLYGELIRYFEEMMEKASE